MSTPREVLNDYCRWRDLHGPDPAAAYVAGRKHADRPAGTVKMPTDANEAALMALIGMAWLKEHAPERLRSWDDSASLAGTFYEAACKTAPGLAYVPWGAVEYAVRGAIIAGVDAVHERMMAR